MAQHKKELDNFRATINQAEANQLNRGYKKTDWKQDSHIQGNCHGVTRRVGWCSVKTY